jgi:hypothetical protein
MVATLLIPLRRSGSKVQRDGGHPK